jgi:hypothetical protein
LLSGNHALKCGSFCDGPHVPHLSAPMKIDLHSRRTRYSDALFATVTPSDADSKPRPIGPIPSASFSTTATFRSGDQKISPDASQKSQYSSFPSVWTACKPSQPVPQCKTNVIRPSGNQELIRSARIPGLPNGAPGGRRSRSSRDLMLTSQIVSQPSFNRGLTNAMLCASGDQTICSTCCSSGRAILLIRFGAAKSGPCVDHMVPSIVA